MAATIQACFVKILLNKKSWKRNEYVSAEKDCDWISMSWIWCMVTLPCWIWPEETWSGLPCAQMFTFPKHLLSPRPFLSVCVFSLLLELFWILLLIKFGALNAVPDVSLPRWSYESTYLITSWKVEHHSMTNPCAIGYAYILIIPSGHAVNITALNKQYQTNTQLLPLLNFLCHSQNSSVKCWHFILHAAKFSSSVLIKLDHS